MMLQGTQKICAILKCIYELLSESKQVLKYLCGNYKLAKQAQNFSM